jgi:16S rRNA (guanine(966)-N(2))-methyltransferase RsmD
MLKIAGGEFRSRVLRSPRGADVTRPMPAMLKEAVFNILRGWFEDANVLDLFAGVGTMGLEAVSRGARRVLMVERNRESYATLKENIDLLGCGDRAEAMAGDALSPLVIARAPAPVHVVFVDPPYSMMENAPERARVLVALEQLRPIMAERSWLVLRTPALPADARLAIPGFAGPETHEYGGEKFVHLYMPRSSPPGESID